MEILRSIEKNIIDITNANNDIDAEMLKKNIKSYFEKRANVPQIHSNLKNGKDLIENLVSDNKFIREGLHKYLKEDLVIYSILNSKIDGL